MTDPLAEVVELLRPSARCSKLVAGAGSWIIARSEAGQPFYCAVLEGGCRLKVDGRAPVELRPGDFLLIPAAQDFEMSSLVAPITAPETSRVELAPGRVRIGMQEGPIDMQMVVGHCSFDSPDAALLVSLLPQQVLVRGQPRLANLVQLVGDESGEQRPARDEVLSRLLEVLFIEALRCSAGTAASPGLLRGLADTRLAAALRAFHARPTEQWATASLAQEASLSRSAFFDRFSRTLGVGPMEYLLTWRMALAKRLLRQGVASLAEIAESVGYSSASTFSMAFARHVGQAPRQYAKTLAIQQGLIIASASSAAVATRR